MDWRDAREHVKRASDDRLRRDLRDLMAHARPESWEIAVRPFVRLVVREQLRRVARRIPR